MTEQLCSAVASRCTCDLPAGHDTAVEPHSCGCGGQWRGGDVDSDDFEPVTFPPGLLTMLLGNG